jgi:predicted dehydrogenase
MRRIKVGIIGQGRSGRNIHAAVLSKMPDMYEIAAVTDPLEERRQRARADFGCEAYEDYRALFARKDLDLIVNATPSHLHVPLSYEFLREGFNVLCEKPLARTVADVDKLIAASRESGKLLAVFQNSRYSPDFVQLRKVLESGVLGRIIRISIARNNFSRRWDWQTLKAHNGGNLLNTGPHHIDQALQLFGTDVMPKVSCILDKANSFGDAEDYVHITLTGEGRPAVDVEISSACAFPNFIFHVQGTCGGLRATDRIMEWKYFKPEEAPERHVTLEPLRDEQGNPIYGRETLRWYEETWAPDADRREDSRTAYYKMLYNTLVNGAPLEVTLEHVRLQVAVIEECFRQNERFSV